jgi:fluoride ion exporter CrcB/FEX
MTSTSGTRSMSLPNGPAVAAILAAAIGCFAFGVLAVLGDQSAAIKRALTLYRPTGVLSGVSTVAVLAWLASWLLLELRWRRRTVNASRICAVSMVLLVLALLLTFPPFADLF